MSNKTYSQVYIDNRKDRMSVDPIDRAVLDIVNIVSQPRNIGDEWFYLDEETRDEIFNEIRSKIRDHTNRVIGNR